MLTVLLLHLGLALLVLAGQKRLGRHALTLGAAGPLAVLVWLAVHAGDIIDGTPYVETVRWVPGLDLIVDLRVDAYTVVFLTVIGVAGTSIFLFAARYFAPGPKLGTFTASMVLFGGAMVGLVASDHLLATFLFWELTTITSYLLIGYADHLAAARSAALHAALVTGGGGLALLAGLVILGNRSGTFLISELVASPPPASVDVGIAWGLILLGAATKSAQFPFHGWLPGAMAAPTPASAFLHSATMVKAGIFLVGRVASAATLAAPWWQPTVLTIGFITMVIGAWQALRQNDLKLLLAFGTVSQLGFLFLLVGAGQGALLYGGLALLVAHGLFKAALFMVVGTIDHEAGTRDLRRLSGLRRSMPGVFWTATAAGASMSAIPLTFGFVSKEAAFDGLVGAGIPLVALAAGASVLTVAYTGRFLIGAFGPHHRDHDPADLGTSTPANALTWAPLVLAAGGLALGLFPSPTAPAFEAATVAAGGTAVGKLVVWPGLVPALGWSLASLSIGLFLVWKPFILQAAIGRVARVSQRLPSADQAFRRFVAGLLSFADRSSSVLQSGSLPRYITIILLVATLLPATAVFGTSARLGAMWEPGSLELILSGLIIAAAATLIFTTRRFAAVLLLGGVGYGVAGLYAVLGGADLAVTQLLVETLVVALFVLVLRHLPARFTPARFANPMRIIVAVAVAGFVFFGGLLAFSSRVDVPVSEQMVELSVPEAQGANVVNVILVDFRGLDTLGEITVLATATLGAAGLALPVLRRRKESP